MAGVAQPRASLRPVDTSWHERAACRDEDPELFYHPDGETGSAKARRIADARAICEECPVLALCRARTLHEEFGIWGGLSEDERAAIRAGNPAGSTKALTFQPVIFQPTKKQRTLEADRVIAHLNKLVDAGFKASAIAAFAGVAPETVRAVLKATGREVYVTTAQKLLSVTVREVAA